jgi:hypothetical protein
MTGHLAALSDRQHDLGGLPEHHGHGAVNRLDGERGDAERTLAAPAVLAITALGGDAAMIVFACGTCEIRASPTAITFDVTAADNETVQRLRALLTNRLEQIGRRDEVSVGWSAGPDPDAGAAWP